MNSFHQDEHYIGRSQPLMDSGRRRTRRENAKCINVNKRRRKLEELYVTDRLTAIEYITGSATTDCIEDRIS